MVTDTMRTLALWTAIVGVVALAALVLMSVGLGFLGPVNDVLGAATGVLAMVLAVATRDLLPDAPLLRAVALVAAVIGAVLVVVGAVLVLGGRTGWYLAGLWTALGWGVLGLWFLALALALRASPDLSPAVTTLGVVGAVLMVVGLAVLPGILAGVDDWGDAGWQLVVPQALGYLGTTLFVLWCLAVARSSG